jgi:hypothetical protein
VRNQKVMEGQSPWCVKHLFIVFLLFFNFFKIYQCADFFCFVLFFFLLFIPLLLFHFCQVLGVVSNTKHRVCCVSVHGCTTPYVDLGARRSTGEEEQGRTQRGSSFTDVLTSTTSAVVSLKFIFIFSPSRGSICARPSVNQVK